MAHNLGDAPASAALAVPGGASASLLADAGASLVRGEGGGFTVTLPPRGTGIWRLR